MGLRRRAGLQRQFDGGEHGLFVMLESQGQNLDHLAVAARRLEHALLQSPEGRRQFDERRAIAQGSGLALNDRQIAPPVVNRCCALPFVGAGKDAAMLAHDLPLGDDDNALGIHPQADRTIGERRRHAVAIAVQMDQARRRHALGVFDEAVERARKLHQAPDFFCPYVADRAGLGAVQRLGPQFPASRLQPVVQRRQGGEVGHRLPEPMAGMPRTFFSICPFSHPEAGLQNSASNRKWLTIAEKRALTWRSLPRPILSTAVRILS
jgi:hypothetical protein